MQFRESETVELKSMVTEEIKKEVIAFANTGGGKLYIGVNDDGSIAGVPNPDQCALQISNMVRDAIRPDVTLFLHYETLSLGDKEILEIEVQRGTSRPYYLAKKGLRPEGVYVRQEYSSVPATDAAIRQMIKETDGDSFEAMRSLEQNLTFQAAGAEFKNRGIPFGEPQMRSLQLKDKDGLYTNLGLLLSDQCRHTIKIAVFEGTDQTLFKDRREFSGSLLQQMNDAYAYIDFHNQTRADFQQLLRIDTRDYPQTAVREALLNSIVHRDYSFRASTLISLYEDRLEFLSIGGLVPGIQLEDIMMGISICRNPLLANVFYRLQLIEAYGTGMQKILGAYRNQKVQPQVEVSPNGFKVILPNQNETAREPVCREEPHLVENEQERILDYAGKNGSITRREAEKMLGVGQTKAGKILRQMVQDGKLTAVGAGRSVRYEAVP